METEKPIQFNMLIDLKSNSTMYKAIIMNISVSKDDILFIFT